MNDVKSRLDAIIANIESVIIGKRDAVEKLAICLICGGHALIEDVPGTGKTTLASAMARSVGGKFSRLQFTPDVLPSDVTGYTIFNPVTGESISQPGAVMCNILLADEINRTSPKTQSALLEAMQERQVTIDGETKPLPAPFMVCATQNPVEQTGTYPLPEAQLDRFLMRVSMGYPAREDELRILKLGMGGEPVRSLPQVVSASDILDLQREVQNIRCSQPVSEYIVDIARKTRTHKDVSLGISPRGAIALARASMGKALASGRDHVIPDDVQQMARPVLEHRIILQTQSYIQSKTASAVLDEVLRLVNVPVMP